MLDYGAAVMRTRKIDEGSPAHVEVQSVEWGSLGSIICNSQCPMSA